MLGFSVTRFAPLILLLAACNMPGLEQSTATPTPKPLTLEEIELAVAQTLEAEATQDKAREPTDTPTVDLPPSATPSESVPTPTGTAQPRCTVVSNALNLRYGPGTVYAPPLLTLPNGTVLVPLARNPDASWIEVRVEGDLVQGWTAAGEPYTVCDIDINILGVGVIPVTPTPSPTPTPAPTSTPTKTNTPKPSSTSCPKFTNASLSAVVDSRTNEVALTWSSSGGCGPWTGTLTAKYSAGGDPWSYDVKGQSGKQTDKPPVRCEGSFEIQYALKLSDSSGQSVTANTTAKVVWIC